MYRSVEKKYGKPLSKLWHKIKKRKCSASFTDLPVRRRRMRLAFASRVVEKTDKLMSVSGWNSDWYLLLLLLLLFVVVLLWKPYRARPHYRESKYTISFCRNECTEEREPRRSLGSSSHNKVLKMLGFLRQLIC